MKRLLGATALLVFAGSAFAGTDVFTDEATFVAQLQPDFYLESFAGSSFGVPFNNEPVANLGPVNGYAWAATANDPAGAPSGIFSVPNRISTNSATDIMTITMTGAPVTAVGGIFESTDFDGLPIPLDVIVTLNDGTTETIASGTDFRGFTSDVPILSLTVDGVDTGGTNNWPAVGQFYVGNVIPEPASLSLLLLGGMFLRRR